MRALLLEVEPHDTSAIVETIIVQKQVHHPIAYQAEAESPQQLVDEADNSFAFKFCLATEGRPRPVSSWLQPP
jgi:hypothetical protein